MDQRDKIEQRKRAERDPAREFARRARDEAERHDGAERDKLLKIVAEYRDRRK